MLKYKKIKSQRKFKIIKILNQTLVLLKIVKKNNEK